MYLYAVTLTATCIAAILATAPAHPNGLTMVRDAIAAQKFANRERLEASRGKPPAPQRTAPHQGRKISSYNVPGNPASRHGTGVSGKIGFGPGRNGMPLGRGYKTDSANGANGSLECREIPAYAGPGRQETTACFVHKLDNSWKTQTYVSRRSESGRTDWGGGLAVGFDY